MLEGITIVDFSRYLPGPYATLRLLERGAKVVKIEDKNGDPARHLGERDGRPGSLFCAENIGKDCLSYDLKDDGDRKMVLRLLETADVVVESFRPGVVKRLGVDYETLRKINRGVIYVSVSGYGQQSFISNLVGHDLNYLSMSGMMNELKDAAGRPINPGVALGDLFTSFAVSEAILAGICQRDRTHEGQYMDISMTDALISCMGYLVTHSSMSSGTDGTDVHGIGYGIFETGDGRYVSMCAMEPKFFANFCRFANKEHLIEHQFTEAVPDNPYYMEIVRFFKSRTFAQWCDIYEDTDFCLAPVFTAGELKDTRYARERGLIESRWGMDYVTSLYTGEKGFLDKYDKPYGRLGEDND